MKVSLFITCLSDIFFPQVGKSVVEIMEQCGVEVDFPEGQTCCGQPAYNSGYQKEAKLAAKQMIQAFAHSEYIVTPSGSCASMVHHYYKELLKEDREWYEKAVHLANRTYELTDFLMNVLGKNDLNSSLDRTAVFHQSCHMSRGLGIKDEPLELLSQVKGLDVKELRYCQDCCGFGGTFAVKMSSISETMVDEKIKYIEEAEADLLIGADMGCLMNIGGRLRRENKEIQVLHIAEVLAKGLEK
ncbi:(Fe-S)-binding protein [Bacillus pfraonensis]|uniref:(Fe-S)-binding protein n=1 Tax=Bacillus TaxID=1386 RepID=UPI002A4FD86C|nr:(Fe-S)-binding protein [Bacillus pseudomycoides]